MASDVIDLNADAVSAEIHESAVVNSGEASVGRGAGGEECTGEMSSLDGRDGLVVPRGEAVCGVQSHGAVEVELGKGGGENEMAVGVISGLAGDRSSLEAGREDHKSMDDKVGDPGGLSRHNLGVDTTASMSFAQEFSLPRDGGGISVAIGGDMKTKAKVRELSNRAEKSTVKSQGVGNDRCASYCLPGEEKGGFSISDLVWGKVKSHPWWPGLILDPSNASEMALKHQRRDSFLVVYFADKTFAWCDESQLKPFCAFFSQLVKQSTSEVFLDALSDALDEVSRCVELGMTCPCVLEQLYSDLKYQRIENAGIRDGVNISVQDLGLPSFQPNRFLEYIGALARFPTGGADRLDLTIAQAQLMAFYRSKGCTRRFAYFAGQGLLEGSGDISPTQSERPTNVLVEHPTPVSVDEKKVPSALTSGKSRQQSGDKLYKRKNIPRKEKSISELMEDNKDAHFVNGGVSGCVTDTTHESPTGSAAGKKCEGTDSVPTESGKRKKKRLDSLGDMATQSSSPIINTSFKVGECIRRVATKLTGSPILKGNGEAVQKNAAKVDPGSGSPFSLDASPPSPEEVQMIVTSILEDHSSMSEMLLQLCLAARDPMKEYGFLSTIVGFFTGVQILRDSGSLEGIKSPDTARCKRGTEKSPHNSISAELVKHSMESGRKMGRKESVPSSSSSEDMELPTKSRRKRHGQMSAPNPCSSKVTESPEKVGHKRGRTRSVPSPSSAEDLKPPEEPGHEGSRKKSTSKILASEVSTPDHMEDSCQTGMVICNIPEGKRRGRKRKVEAGMQSKQLDPSNELSDLLPLSLLLDIPRHLRHDTNSPNKHRDSASGRKAKKSKKKCKDPSPTALILNFSDSCYVPSETDLIRIFTDYGPLNEAETEVLKEMKCATVFFKRRAGAETAFNSVGKCGIFGSALASYQLRYSPPTPKGSPHPIQVEKDSLPEDEKPVTEVSSSTNVEKPVTEPHLEVSGTVVEERSSRDSTTEILARKGSEPMEICSTEVPTNGGNLEALGSTKDPGHTDVCDVEVQGHRRDERPVKAGYLDVRGVKSDKTPMEGGDLIAVSAEDPTYISPCNLVVSGTEKDESPLDLDNVDVLRVKKDETSTNDDTLEVSNVRDHSASADICSEVPGSKTDFAPVGGAELESLITRVEEIPVNDGNMLVSVSKADEKPLDCGNKKAPGNKTCEMPVASVDKKVSDAKLSETTSIGGNMEVQGSDEVPGGH